MKAAWAWGCLYLAAYGYWGWLFRSNVDSWARRLLGDRLGLKVVWLPATTFPIEIWLWGLVGRARASERSVMESRLALGSAAMCLTGAFLPTAALCIVLRWSPSLARELGPALYLTTPMLIVLFVASHLKRRAPEPSESGARGGRNGDGPGDRGPCAPPGRLDARPTHKKM